MVTQELSESDRASEEIWSVQPIRGRWVCVAIVGVGLTGTARYTKPPGPRMSINWDGGEEVHAPGSGLSHPGFSPIRPVVVRDDRR